MEAKIYFTIKLVCAVFIFRQLLAPERLYRANYGLVSHSCSRELQGYSLCVSVESAHLDA